MNNFQNQNKKIKEMLKRFLDILDIDIKKIWIY